jgi:tRNA(Ile)-lysidine synthase
MSDGTRYDLTDAVRETIRRFGLISQRDTVLAAVSGGPDSVCMLYVLAELRGELGFELRVAHLDHRFRGEESRGDAEFVRELASDLDLPCRCEEENVPEFLLSHAMSKQEAARMLRYRFLIRVAKQEYCQRIATGHNADDQAETVLMRVLRGAGPDGLAGIPIKRDGLIIRPLLRVRRSDVEAYLDERRLAFRTDASNLVASSSLRNRVRLDLMPRLAEYNPNVSQALSNLGAIMAGVSGHLARLTDRALPEVVKTARLGQFALDLDRLAGYDEALQRSVFRRIFESLRPDLPPLLFRHVEAMMDLVRGGEVGASVELPDGARARLEHGCLVVVHGEGPPPLPARELPVPGAVVFDDAGIAITAELIPTEAALAELEGADRRAAFFDWDALRPPLTVRPRREGDRFQPFGMTGTKSLKEYFIDSKVASSFRPAVPLVIDRQGILWVVGMRRSATAPVTTATRTALALRAERLEEGTGAGEGPSH